MLKEQAKLNTQICLTKWYLENGSMYERCMLILCLMSIRSSSDWFEMPVSIDLVPDYLEVINNPMDYSTVRNQLKSGHYNSMDKFASDMRLIFHNAMVYNWWYQHECHIAAIKELKAFEAYFMVASRSFHNGRFNDRTKKTDLLSAAESLLMMSFGY